MTDPPAVTFTSPDNPARAAVLRTCAAPAPLVANGAPYVGCTLPKDHDGEHMVVIRWTR